MNMIGLLCTIVRPVAVRRNTPCLRSVCFFSAGSNRAFKALSKCFRQTAESTGRFICYSLPSRALVKVYGQDTSSFLQGMITNDMNLLGDGEQKSLYAHMLNVKGRTLYDIIIYSLNEPSEGLDNVLLECDSAVLDALTQHLNMYKIRRKVAVDACVDLSLWALLPLDTHSVPQPPMNPPVPTAPGKVLVLVPDPRTHLMGWRLITRTSDSPLDFIAVCQQGDPNEYHSHRYKIGLPEGARDLLPGEALPLESNLEYMNGISFSKGCYIGQELTARTHHTGVVRKRLMPVRLSAPAEPLQEGVDLQSPEGKSAGKHRAGIGRVGLSLVRTAHVGEVLTLTHSQDVHVTLKASVPDWWPKDTKS